MLVFQDLEGLTEAFAPGTSAGISAWMSAGYPAPKLTLWAAFLFLIFTLRKIALPSCFLRLFLEVILDNEEVFVVTF